LLLVFLLVLGGLCVAFALCYALARHWDNYGVVDVAWSYAFAPVAIIYAWAGPGWEPRRWLVAALALVWSLRLGTHLLRRVAAHHPVEDSRYVQLRRDWAGVFHRKMFGFFQLQALSISLLSLPFLLPTANPTPGFLTLELIALGLWILAIAGEALADAQLATFKRQPENRGRVCNVGLWRYSRHPNYFFEWLIWVALALFASASPLGWLAWTAPAAILFLLLRVTGVPLAEEQALRTRGEAYRRYQATTSAFVPWFPKSADRNQDAAR
jgi:steroid 5-alpha reductase family enzyme